LTPSAPLAAQRCVPADSLAHGREAYQANDLPGARAVFRQALDRCPDDLDAAIGLGYVWWRTGMLDSAAAIFTRVADRSPTYLDAWTGLALVAERRGDLDDARRLINRALALRADDPGARALADRLPPERQPLVRPSTLRMPARTHRGHFDVRTSDAWSPFYLRGVNLGAALPGRHPSEFPDDTVYGTWIDRIAALGFNVIRVYTIHPPGFYRALAAHNREHPDLPLRVVHGVWTGLPPDDNYNDVAWEHAFFSEMQDVVDVVHGRADLAPRPGKAAGFYTADVSPWVLAYIIGREWEAHSVVAFDRNHPARSSWQGRYFTIRNAPATDVWMAQALDTMVAYETDRYHTQRPIAYTNWPTLDPLHHVSESTNREEVALRQALGETLGEDPFTSNDDEVGLDATRIETTPAMQAGYFASFHAYPYYPDFMVNERRYAEAARQSGRSAWFHYLQDLRRYHGELPVVIAEYGLPSSLTAAHLQPDGLHHGGLSERAAALGNARLTGEIADAGLAGGILFSWIDEWFKKNWLVSRFELPGERNRLWWNRLDPEQHYGVYAMEPEPRPPGRTLTDRLPAWRRRPALYADPRGSVRLAADEAALSILIEAATSPPPERILVGIDLIDPDAGNLTWPGNVGPRPPVGIEFVIDIRNDEVRVLANPGVNPIGLRTIRDTSDRPLVTPTIRANVPPELFSGRIEQYVVDSVVPDTRDDGVYDSLRIVPNRPRVGRDTTEYAGIGYDRGVLPRGERPDGDWTAQPDSGRYEIRVPWMLLNVTDPSSHRVLLGQVARATPFETVTIDSAGIVVAVAYPGERWIMWPASGRRADVHGFRWPEWEEPRWTTRERPTGRAMHDAFGRLDPGALRTHVER